jgi:glycine betaine/proline transport system permease protein
MEMLLDPFAHGTIPFGDWVEAFILWLVENFRGLLLATKQPVQILLNLFDAALNRFHPAVALALLFGIGWLVSGLRAALAVLTAFLFIGLIGAWAAAMTTLSIVLTALTICALIGLPLGIWMAKSDRVAGIVRPVLDFLQTIPSFAYLVPVVMLFGIGNVPGVIVTCFYALAPLVRLTNLGIREVRQDLTEASDAFGASPLQRLFRVELPLARPTIMAGLNQTIMLSLNMAVVASMIAVAGLGRMVLEGIGRLDVGVAAVGGLGIVLLAIGIDRITQGLGASRRVTQQAWYDLPLGALLLSRSGTA